MSYSVKQLAQISGVSIRTLHWYDEIGLLKPAFLGANGYRYYEEEQLLLLQQVLFFRELGFKLNDIKKVLKNDDFDKVRALNAHKHILEEGIDRTKQLIETINKTILHLRGKQKMEDKDLYSGFDPDKQGICDAKFWKEHAVSQESVTSKVVKEISFRGDEHILDIGCRVGNITKSLAEKVVKGEVIGIDSSAEMIQQAIDDYTDIKNLSFQIKNAENFKFDKKFELVTSFLALHWVKDHAKVIKSIRGVLKNKGRICLLMASGDLPKKVNEVFQRDPWKSEIIKLEDRVSIITKQSYNQLLDQFGFVKDRVELIEIMHTYPTRKQFINNLMTFLPYGTGLSKERCLILADEIVDAISAESNQQINIDAPSSLLYVEAHI